MAGQKISKHSNATYGNPTQFRDTIYFVLWRTEFATTLLEFHSLS
jgi:hypothetical protein